MLAAGVPASEAPKPPTLTPNQIDAETIFARQAGTIPLPTTTVPAVVGAYLWGGRADINYRPFFQWELRLTAGTAAVSHLRMRITTLGPNRQTLSAGAWQNCPDLGAGASVEISYRQNCTIFPAYQVDLSWTGGQESFLASDKGAVPISLSQLSNQGYVVAVNLAYEADADHAGAVDVSWSDWNVGGKTAHGVIHTLHLYNAAGKVIKDLPYPLPKGKELAVNAVAEQHWHLTAPTFATISMSVEQADDGPELEAQGFTSAKDVEVAFVHADGTLLKAMVRNGLSTAQEDLVVIITLQDAKGADLKSIEVPVGHLSAGDTVAVSAPLPAAISFAGYATTWKAGTPAAATAAVPGTPERTPSADGHHSLALDQELAVASVHGLTFTATSLERTDCGLLIHGTLHNRTGRELTALHLRISAADGEQVAVLSWKTAHCQDRAEEHLTLACPLESISQLTLQDDSAQ